MMDRRGTPGVVGSRAFALLAAFAVLAFAAGCGSSSDNGGEVNLTGSGYPGIDAANTRQAHGTVDSSNVTSLEQVWTTPIRGVGPFGSYASTPVIDKGVIYSQ